LTAFDIGYQKLNFVVFFNTLLSPNVQEMMITYQKFCDKRVLKIPQNQYPKRSHWQYNLLKSLIEGKNGKKIL
jgi:hypothetical protein